MPNWKRFCRGSPGIGVTPYSDAKRCVSIEVAMAQKVILQTIHHISDLHIGEKLGDSDVGAQDASIPHILSIPRI